MMTTTARGGKTDPRSDYTWLFGDERRPSFPSAIDYIAHVTEALRRRCDYWPPEMREEYLALESAYPREARRMMPSTIELRRLGLPDDYGQPVDPISRRLRRAIIAAIEQDADFRTALRGLLVDGAA